MFNNEKKRLTEKDYEFMNSLSSAILQVTPNRLKFVLVFWIIAIFMFLLWANFAMIDEIARGDGEIIPSGQNQMIQNLEGGIVKEILVKEGQVVIKGQVLIKIDNQKSKSSFNTNAIKVNSLEAKIIRLKSESSGKNFTASKKLKKLIPILVNNEKSLYLTNKKQLKFKIDVLKEQSRQKKNELSEARTEIKYLKSSLNMINEEVIMTKPMVKRGVSSKIDFLKLKREKNEIHARYLAIVQSIPRLKSAINEVNIKISEATLIFQNEAKLKMNEAVTELRSLKVNQTALEDQVIRTVVRSPMKGIVQTLFVHTLGGVIKPGDNIMEIVPSEQTLLVEVKVKPSDIAFIYFEQKAIVKFSAYDFSIYGGLDGKVMHISADTIKDKKDNVFYTVRIKTNKNYLGHIDKPLKIIPGMTVNVDIITGKKSVLDYILKPILKTKQYTFTER